MGPDFSLNLTDSALAKTSERLGSRFVAAGRSLATAESCTGGFIAKVLTDIAGSSGWFIEGFVTYSNAAKTHRLGVPKRLLRKYGAVSEAVARTMAKGALRVSGADAAVAVTGIAGPGGAAPGKPVGTVWFCWAERHGRQVRVRSMSKRFRGSRDTVRRKTVRVALMGFSR
jgi:nicotinamide-nucleotide amidase